MMQFLPQGYSFPSYSNPYQSQFVSPFYGSGQYGWQYSPMAQYAPRLSSCGPGSCPPWLPPGIVATPSSGVQELSVLFDPTLAARMSRAYNAWTIARWGKPDIPAWLWPDGASPTPTPPNVCCERPPCVGVPPPGSGPGGPGITPGYTNGPGITPGYLPPSGPSITPGYTGGPSITPGSVPPASSSYTPSGPSLGSYPSGSSAPSPNPARRKASSADRRRRSRLERRERRVGPSLGWTELGVRGWCGPGESLCTKKSPDGKSNFCCCASGTKECSGGKIVLA